MSELRTYLGDGVYADALNGMIVLTTEDGYRETNRIFLEQQVLDALLAFVERLRVKAQP